MAADHLPDPARCKHGYVVGDDPSVEACIAGNSPRSATPVSAAVSPPDDSAGKGNAVSDPSPSAAKERADAQDECWRNDVMAAIADPSCTRDDAAVDYAMAIRAYGPEGGWREVNEAIIARWSLSALTYIKTKAWKMARGR